MPSIATTSPARAPLLRKALKRRDAGAEQRGRIDVGQVVRNAGQRLRGADHVLRIAAVIADARHPRGLAEDEVAMPAVLAMAAVAAVPTHADALADAPFIHAPAQLIDHAGDFVARYAGS